MILLAIVTSSCESASTSNVSGTHNFSHVLLNKHKFLVLKRRLTGAHKQFGTDV